MAFGIGKGARDPRDAVGQNPTGRPRKSSAGKRQQEAKKDPKTRKGGNK